MTTASKTKMLEGLLIDPFKTELRRVQIAHDLGAWYKLLKCDTLANAELARDDDGYCLDLWYDDEFTFHDPLWPGFMARASEAAGGQQWQLHGYGLVLASDRDGTTTSLPTSDEKKVQFGAALGLRFERWRLRLPEETFLDELLRTPELEMAGEFRYLDTE